MTLPTAQPSSTGDRRSGASRRPAGIGGRRGADTGPAPTAWLAAEAHAALGPTLPPENELWDVRAAARFLRMSTSWVYKRVEDGTLPVARLNGFTLRFEPSALRDWASTHVAGRRSAARSRR